jgi:hypothetical protein
MLYAACLASLAGFYGSSPLRVFVLPRYLGTCCLILPLCARLPLGSCYFRSPMPMCLDGLYSGAACNNTRLAHPEAKSRK